MNIWTINNWEIIYKDRSIRKGLRLRSDKEVDYEVRRSCKEFCNWLRTQYYFPVRVPVYLKSARRLKAMDGDIVCGTFFEPGDIFEEPYIRLATGDYEEMQKKYGKDDALAAILRTMAHELTHYFQWINQIELTPLGAERQATHYSRLILYEYAETREHP